MPRRLQLTVACGLYDRMLDLYTGVVQPDGVELNFIPLGAREIFDRMAGGLEFDVAEMSSSEFVARKAAGQSPLEHAMSQTLNASIAVVGIDIGKNSFHLVGQD